ncbi:unnamed protein product [Pleuronectes platessa]|uniref:PEA3-type ETS-domain transcription factor N-terminal domain-containing protein n=1 Tax=Pleuronectes platessa TaxID=8262 RepID=A0A9N7UTC6_PLEPL|nr:unnamed protein product [Pleuronectes platessa]
MTRERSGPQRGLRTTPELCPAGAVWPVPRGPRLCVGWGVGRSTPACTTAVKAQPIGLVLIMTRDDGMLIRTDQALNSRSDASGSSGAIVAFHGLQLKIKRELHSPCSELSSNCSQERLFKLQYGEKCPYNVR